MAFQLIGVIVTLLAVFGVLVSTIGYVNFTNSIKNEYSVTTFHMADTAATLVNGDHLDEYLDGNYQDEYRLTKSYLDGYCRRMYHKISGGKDGTEPCLPNHYCQP